MKKPNQRSSRQFISSVVLFFSTLIAMSALTGCRGSNNNSANLACPVGTTYYNGSCYTGQGGLIHTGAFGYQNGF
jgi:hypothetical protein